MLIEHGADVDARDKEGKTPLHEAVSTDPQAVPEASSLAMARLLIEHGASVNVKDKDGRTPLAVAASTSVKSLLL